MFLQDLKIIQILENGTELVSEHYPVPLQVRYDKVNLPSSYSQAEKRFVILKRKLSRNTQFKEGNMKFMNRLILKGSARESTYAVETGKCWY